MAERPTVALLGTGIMGTGIAHSLLRAGLELRVWNRTREKAEPLAADGAKVMSSPAEAGAGADVVITMLTNGEATENVARQMLSAMDDAVWAQMGTVGVRALARLAALAAGAGVGFVDDPVSGTREIQVPASTWRAA